MCGIAGVVSTTRESNITEALVHHMCEQIVYRGPDDEGIYVADGAGRALPASCFSRPGLSSSFSVIYRRRRGCRRATRPDNGRSCRAKHGPHWRCA